MCDQSAGLLSGRTFAGTLMVLAAEGATSFSVELPVGRGVSTPTLIPMTSLRLRGASWFWVKAFRLV